MNAITAVLDQAGLEALAGRLAVELPSGSVVWLDGPLGAGKTTFVRAFMLARGCPVAATSPTYALAHRHDSEGGELWHLDCYRLRDPEEAADLDWERFTSADVLLIEWPGRAGAWAAPPNRIVRLSHEDELTRRVEVQEC
jgi:tRNA threonylcarbamoyladenosine biosynthesis protein TsaE